VALPDKPKAHRHTWTRGEAIRGQAGLSYVWFRCPCGLRRVDTLGAVGRVARRWVKQKG
jgi:hypothetical protein